MFKINPKTAFFYIECNGCGKRPVGGEEYRTSSEAEFLLPYAGWLCVWNHIEKEHYCPACYNQGLDANKPYRILGTNVIIKED